MYLWRWGEAWLDLEGLECSGEMMDDAVEFSDRVGRWWRVGCSGVLGRMLMLLRWASMSLEGP